MLKKSQNDRTQTAHDYMLLLGALSVAFSEVERAPRYPNGKRESDVEHSFHLAVSAVELAADFYPKLDVGLVSQFSLVHDLPEVYAGDVWTFNISDADRLKKEIHEAEATEKLLKVLPPYLAQLLSRYETQKEPEARFVRFVDKLLPAIINIMAGDANTFKEDYNVATLEDLLKSREVHREQLLLKFPEFDAVHLVKDLLFSSSADYVYGPERYKNIFKDI
jgi:5'-deoxynucleotidase YfbR-like HD superfamily hydrolase